MGVKERKERERSEVREKILDAALDVFAQEGVDGVTMRALADAIEYSAPVIYSHFRDKEALILELCHREMRALGQVFAAIGRVGDPVERLRRIGRAYVDFALEHPSHFRFMFLTAHAFTQEMMDEAERNDPERHAYAFLTQTVQDGLEAGCFRPEFKDADEIVQLCWASAHGLVALHNVKHEEKWLDWGDARATAYKLLDATMVGLTTQDAPARLTTTQRGSARMASKRATRR
jgi:AcrR family transcriptional regulator